MKIGFDAKRLYNNFTGLGNYSRALLKNLHTFYPQHTYHLYSPKYKSTPETQFFLDNPSFKSTFPKSFQPLWRSYLITNQLKSDNIDLYHGLSHELPLNIKKSGIPSVVTIHDLIFKKYPETYPRVDRNIYDFKFRRACANANQIIAISESTKKDIVHTYEIHPKKISVAYQSCNPIYYQPPTAHWRDVQTQYLLPNDYLLFVGSVEARKNVTLIIQAYQLLTENLKLPLVIVGKVRQNKKIMTLIHAAKLEKWIIWIENLADNSHLHAIYHQAQALIYPSLYEGFGLPVVEALLSKTPVITSNVSALPEAGGPNSLYINPNEPEDLAQAIDKVLTDTSLRKNMILSGSQYAHEKFGQKVVTDVMMDVYEDVIG